MEPDPATIEPEKSEMDVNATTDEPKYETTAWAMVRGRWTRLHDPRTAGVPGSVCAPSSSSCVPGAGAASGPSDAAQRICDGGAMVPGGGLPRDLPPKRSLNCGLPSERIRATGFRKPGGEDLGCARTSPPKQAQEDWPPLRLSCSAPALVGWHPQRRPTVPIFTDQGLTRLRRRSPYPLGPLRRGRRLYRRDINRPGKGENRKTPTCASSCESAPQAIWKPPESAG